ncbi:MAG: NAD(P)/FAD-dependent oxidoreductase [Candidatus Omnitrophota bacterium]
MSTYKYDVVIIGAGIGGLVCANYLAKTGKKVCILEQNNYAGGYCSSFSRDGYFFDAGPHMLNALKPKGIFCNILKELKIWKKSDYSPINPIVLLYNNRERYVFNTGYRQCLKYLKNKFPNEDANKIFSLAQKNYLELYNKYKDILFTDMLDEYFKDLPIKVLFCALFYALGIVPSKISALYALILIKAIVIDGAFYPVGGMQTFSSRLLDNFLKHAGTVHFKARVENISLKKDKLYYISDRQKNCYRAQTIASNISPHQLLKMFARKDKTISKIKKTMTHLEPLHSTIVLHLGLKHRLDKLKDKTPILYIKTKKKMKKPPDIVNKASHLPMGCLCVPLGKFQGIISPSNKYSLNIMRSVPFHNSMFWEKNKYKYAQAMINFMEEVIPGLSNAVAFKAISTPATFKAITSNAYGSVGGWIMTPEAINNPFPYANLLPSIYNVGHWTFPGIGVLGSAISARNCQRLILKAFPK